MTTQSLANGAAGAALLPLELGEDARPWLTAMVAEPVMAHPDEATLFEGAPAVAFTLAATSPRPVTSVRWPRSKRTSRGSRGPGSMRHTAASTAVPSPPNGSSTSSPD